ncbi:M23 family metallopeptidase [Aurantiacibacter hainanensis]|uniref:M23 family metallopeptidase n=1 Tax=Aurantiacibacter hainanensis TaxID=3076114 RepID=UPI0030C7291B
MSAPEIALSGGSGQVWITSVSSASVNAQPRAEVTVGFDTVQGATRYAVRSEDENGMATVRFSATRPRPGAENASLPVGLPVSGARLSSRYGYRVHPLTGRGSSHQGLDLAVATGTPVSATSGGRVVVAGWSGGYGLLVTIDHGGGVETRYGHLSAVSVRPGDIIEDGQMIGRSGSTGRSTGPHVHYEIRVDGYSVDPAAAN